MTKLPAIAMIALGLSMTASNANGPQSPMTPRHIVDPVYKTMQELMFDAVDGERCEGLFDKRVFDVKIMPKRWNPKVKSALEACYDRVNPEL